MKSIIQKSGFFVLLVAGSLFASCNKNDDNNTSSGKATVNMHLTDGPANYDAVYLDIQQVELTMSSGNPITLVPIRPGIYDILKFRNGLDTLLVQADVPAGTIQQIRLILGANNSVVVNGVTEPLTTPSGQTSGVKLNLHETFVAGNAYDIWIDFDVSKSIVETGNGTYLLKPVIRAYSSLSDGIIEGYTIPVLSLPVVYAINGSDTFSAIPDPNTAYFKLRGLPEATYNVWIDAQNPAYQDKMITNVSVQYGHISDLGSIVIQPLP